MSRLADGRSVVLWVSGGQTRTMARFLDGAGLPVGGAFDLVAADPLKVTVVKSAPTPDGGFLVARQHGVFYPFGCTPSNELRVERYSSAGAQLSSREFLAGVFGVDFHLRPDGTGVVSANGQDPCGHSPIQLFTSDVGSDDSANLAPFSSIGAFTDRGSTVVPLAGGTAGAIVMTGSTLGGPGPLEQLYYRQRKADGTWGPLLAIPGAANERNFPATAEALSDGNLVVMWSLPSGDGSVLHVAVLRPDGSIVCEETQAWSGPVSDIALANLGNGSFVAAWQVESSTSDGARAVITTQHYALSGSPLEAPQQAVVRATAAGAVRAGRGFSLSAGEDGHFLLAFMRADTSGAVVDVIGR